MGDIIYGEYRGGLIEIAALHLRNEHKRRAATPNSSSASFKVKPLVWSGIRNPEEGIGYENTYKIPLPAALSVGSCLAKQSVSAL